MENKLKNAAIIVLAIGFITVLLHDFKVFGNNRSNMGVVYLADYECQAELEEAKEKCSAYNRLLHRIWIDNPLYVDDVLKETDEYLYLDSITNLGDVFSFWTSEDSVAYLNNTYIQLVKDDLFFIHYRQPDEMPEKATQIR